MDAKQLLQKEMLAKLGISMDLFEKNPVFAYEKDKKGKDKDGAKNVVRVEGIIVDDLNLEMYEWVFGADTCTSPKKVAKQIENCDGDITLVINSYGGSVWAAADIHTQLTQYEGGIHGVITGLAASAATTIMLAADILEAGEMATVMIHNSAGCACGGGDALVSYGNYMNSIDAKAAKMYATKASKSGVKDTPTQDEFAEMMDKETWLTADEALKVGLIDGIVEHLSADDDDGDDAEKKDAKQSADDASLENDSPKNDSSEVDSADAINKTEDELKAIHQNAFDFLTLID